MEQTYTVITGASSGIGREAARAFAGRGCNLVLAARRQERLEELRREILAGQPDLDVVVCRADLAAEGEPERLYRELSGLEIETWINNAGVGSYGAVGDGEIRSIQELLRLDVEAVAVLSSLYVRDYKNTAGAQLINVASCGGYIIVPTAVTYCAAKFFVTSFTEGLARELREAGAKLQAKVLAPAATETEFGKIANHVSEYSYDEAFGNYHTSRQAAQFLMELYDSSCIVGLVDRESFRFHLWEPLLPYAGGSAGNQQPPAAAPD